MLTPLSLGWQFAHMLRGGDHSVPRAGKPSGIADRLKGKGAAAGPKTSETVFFVSKSSEELAVSWVATVLRLVLYLGACSIFARANPTMSGPAKVLVYVLFLFVAELYLIYFCGRLFIAQLRKARDYETLATPAPFFSRK